MCVIFIYIQFFLSDFLRNFNRRKMIFFDETIFFEGPINMVYIKTSL